MVKRIRNIWNLLIILCYIGKRRRRHYPSERGANTESEANVCQHTQEKNKNKITLACEQAKKWEGRGGKKRKR